MTDRRILAAVLMVDLVGSTEVASELGDVRWRALLTHFRREVRKTLRRHGGRERETTGDGFIATFLQPAKAVHAAAAIAGEAQRLGLDVRGGIHIGECEVIEGSVGGLAVHIAARVMALAGAAEMLTTQTVRDVVAGSDTEFEERGSATLKGVDGQWSIVSVRSVEGERLPVPLHAEEARARRESVLAHTRAVGRRRGRVVAGAIVVLVALATGVAVLSSAGGHAKTPVAAAPTAPPTLIRVDMNTARIVGTVRGLVHGSVQADPLQVFDGTLWQVTGNVVDTWAVARNVSTGAIEHTIHLPADYRGLTFGLGSLWVLTTPMILSGPNAGLNRTEVDRIDDVSGRRLATIPIGGGGNLGSIAFGNGAIWALESDGTLVRIDPLSNRVTGRFKTHALETTALIPLDGYDWICECLYNKLLRFDPRSDQAKTIPIAESGVLVGVDSTAGNTLWLLDAQAATLTPINPRTGVTGQPLGLVGNPESAVISGDAIWTAAGHVVDRVDLVLKTRTTIPMPAGFNATVITADAPSHSLWIGTSGP